MASVWASNAARRKPIARACRGTAGRPQPTVPAGSVHHRKPSVHELRSLDRARARSHALDVGREDLQRLVELAHLFGERAEQALDLGDVSNAAPQRFVALAMDGMRKRNA